MKVLFKLVVLLSATGLTLAAPIDEEASTKTISTVDVIADLKDKSNVSKDSALAVEEVEQKEPNQKESPIIKDILDKLDKSDIKEVIDEEMASKTKSLVNSAMSSDVRKGDDTTQTSIKTEVEDEANNKLSTPILKSSDNTEFIKKITEETDKQLKDVASAVAEVVTSLPVPIRPDAPSKVTEVVGHFISELLQIPMVLLHAISNAIATLTNNKVNIPTPTFLYPVTQTPPH